MRWPRALMGEPSSISWRMVAGEPVITTRWMSPPRAVISARSASTCIVPWVMMTPPEKTIGPLSSSVPAWRPASMSIGWLRSERRASALPAASRPARAIVSRALAARGDIAALDLGVEFIPFAGKVDLHAAALDCRAGLFDGHPLVALGDPGVRIDVQPLGLHGHGLAGIVGALGAHVLAQVELVVVGGHQGGPRTHLPVVAVAVRQQEQGGVDPDRAVLRMLFKQRCAQGEGLGALVAQRREFEIVQHVIRARRAVGFDQRRGALAPRRPCRDQGGHQQHQHQGGPPAHAPRPSTVALSRPSTRPWAASSRSHSSRAAPSPPWATVCQWASRAVHGWALPGATARPTARMTARSGRSSPMKATSSMPIPISDRSWSTRANLSATAQWASIRSSLARRSTAALARAVTRATRMPALRNRLRPMPSCTWNDLVSPPAASKWIRPSVSVPSTSKQASRMRAAREMMAGSRVGAAGITPPARAAGRGC